MASGAQGRDGSRGRLADSLFLLESARFSRPAPGDPAELTTQHALAVRYWGAGRRAEALSMFEDIVSRSRLILGPTHIDTLVAEGNLAATYASLERWDRAIPALEAAVGTRLEVLGPDHAVTHDAVNALAAALQLIGRTVQARALHEQVVQRRRGSLGSAHQDTLTARLGLALTFVDEGRVDIAVMQLAAAIEDADSVSSDVPPLLLAVLRTHLGLCFEDLGQQERARAIVHEAIEALSAATSPHDPEVIELRNCAAAMSLLQ